MHAYLIVGGDRESRKEKLEEVLSQNGVWKWSEQMFALGGGEDSLKIEDVREAEGWIGLKRKKLGVLIVEEACRLTWPAQHAFLKTLEEPGENVLIVLTAADGLSLLATIRSRCKIIRLPAAAAEAVDGEKFRKLLSGTAAERLVYLYPILKEITGSTASLHRGAVKRGEGINFLEAVIPSAARNSVILEAAVGAHRRLKNNINPTLVLHQFVMDISAFS